MTSKFISSFSEVLVKYVNSVDTPINLSDMEKFLKGDVVVQELIKVLKYGPKKGKLSSVGDQCIAEVHSGKNEGNQCSFTSESGSSYCYKHRNQGDVKIENRCVAKLSSGYHKGAQCPKESKAGCDGYCNMHYKSLSKSPKPTRPRCQAQAGKGNNMHDCKRYAVDETNYCKLHQDYDDRKSVDVPPKRKPKPPGRRSKKSKNVVVSDPVPLSLDDDDEKVPDNPESESSPYNSDQNESPISRESLDLVSFSLDDEKVPDNPESESSPYNSEQDQNAIPISNSVPPKKVKKVVKRKVVKKNK